MDWPLLSPLPPAERERLLASTRRRTYPRGDAVVREGDPSDSLHLVESGRLAVRVDTTAGDTAIFNVLVLPLFAGIAFTELCLAELASLRSTAPTVVQ